MIRLNQLLSCAFYQNEIIKEMKSSLEANFCNVLNLTYSINGHVPNLNRRMNAIERRSSLCFKKDKDDKT